MSELRRDTLSDRWVIVAENRADKPDDFEQSGIPHRCPFCPGNEVDTPDSVATYFLPGEKPAGNWQVRVVPNKYPAVTPGGVNGNRRPLANVLGGLHFAKEGAGIHEVVIESPQHVLSLSDLSPEQASLVFLSYRDRLAALRQDRALAYGMVFKNVGAAGGASLEHAHSQIIATTFVPTEVRREIAAAQQYYKTEGKCCYCTTLDQELAAGVRFVGQSQSFAAFCPFAGRFPYETWVLPRRHASRFEESSPDQLAELAAFVRDLIGRIESALGPLAYNYIIHTEPFDTPRLDHYHWHIEILPRITRTAGFEWGAGCYINPVPPEEAAAVLRSIPVGKTS
jgi:UDPglucose--hexose-1-phosphate uridylyltransferase